jgi:hypothetical protein
MSNHLSLNPNIQRSSIADRIRNFDRKYYAPESRENAGAVQRRGIQRGALRWK